MVTIHAAGQRAPHPQINSVRTGANPQFGGSLGLTMAVPVLIALLGFPASPLAQTGGDSLELQETVGSESVDESPRDIFLSESIVLYRKLEELKLLPPKSSLLPVTASAADITGAETLLNTAIETFEAVSVSDPADVLFKTHTLEKAQFQLLRMLLVQKKYDEAWPLAEQTLAMFESHVPNSVNPHLLPIYFLYLTAAEGAGVTNPKPAVQAHLITLLKGFQTNPFNPAASPDVLLGDLRALDPVRLGPLADRLEAALS